MKETLLILMMVILVLTELLQGTKATSSQDEEKMINRRLKLINKHPTKSYTMHGDILDCVEINKQLAFDHPLLKNHSIQRKPKFKVSNKEPSTQYNSSKILRSSQLLPKNIRCPRGTVLIRRIKAEDLTRERSSSLLGMLSPTSNSSKPVCFNDAGSSGHQVANLVTSVKNIGVSGEINVWKPEVTPQQFSHAYVQVASDNGPVNGIAAGWTVNPYLYENFTRLFTYWTKDGGKTTGCFNTVCPGFIQVSQKVPLGLIIQPVSTYAGDQYSIKIAIQQDQNMNWWLKFGEELVGYWPDEIFSSLRNGATRAAWGGEICSPPTEASPPMGSGHFPEEGFSKACMINGLNLVGPKTFPSKKDLGSFLTKPDCYKVVYGNGAPKKFGRYMFFGGPPNCKL